MPKQVNSLFHEWNSSGAEISACGDYRYNLKREWGAGKGVTWLMFNPSTADATEDDHTIRKCVGFSSAWGYGRMTVVNLFAIRSRNPRAVHLHYAPVGVLNDYWIKEAAIAGAEVICAWGCAQHAPAINDRISDVLELLSYVLPDHCELNCLGFRKDGHPKHPLTLPYSTPRQAFKWVR